MEGTLNGLLKYPLEQIPFVLLALFISFTVHEFAHAYSADRFGDPTPRSMGRVTLNPRAHVDILGAMLVLVAGFGWAKPVLVQRSFFKKPRLMGAIVSLVGPLSNLLIAFLALVFVHGLHHFDLLPLMSDRVIDALDLFLRILISLNLVLFIFNLLPLPPLDGYRILQEFLPNKIRAQIQPYEHWAIFLFLLIVFIRPLFDITLGPIFAWINPIYLFLDRLAGMLFGYSF